MRLVGSTFRLEFRGFCSKYAKKPPYAALFSVADVTTAAQRAASFAAAAADSAYTVYRMPETPNAAYMAVEVTTLAAEAARAAASAAGYADHAVAAVHALARRWQAQTLLQYLREAPCVPVHGGEAT